MTDYQMQKFYTLVAEIDLVARNESEEAKTKMLVRAWADMHNRLLIEGSTVGLGGYLRESHVKKLLRSAGRQIRNAALDPEKVLAVAQ
jgi:hypothetical protein